MSKYDYKALKNIDEKVEKVLEKLGIDAPNTATQAIEGKQNFYVITANYKGRKVFFKARVGDHRVLKQWGKNFRNERRFLRTIQSHSKDNAIVKRMPTYIKSQMTNCEWLMCEFIDKKTIGSSNISYDDPTKKALLKIIDLLLDIQKFSILEFKNNHSWGKNIRQMDYEHSHDLFHKLIRRNRKRILPILGQDRINQADEIIRKNRKKLDKYSTLLAHGDFHPANVIINSHAIAIDWEQLHIDNASCDLCDLWFRMVDHPKSRKFLLLEFAKKTKQKEVFKDLFRLNLLIRLPRELGMWTKLENETSNNSRRSKIAKIIRLCYSNFESAIKNEELDKYE